jgi:hypothetical protein
LNVDFGFITANKDFFKKPRRKGAQKQLNKENRRELWLKEIKDAMIYEQLYLKVKVKDKQYD